MCRRTGRYWAREGCVACSEKCRVLLSRKIISRTLAGGPPTHSYQRLEGGRGRAGCRQGPWWKPRHSQVTSGTAAHRTVSTATLGARPHRRLWPASPSQRSGTDPLEGTSNIIGLSISILSDFLYKYYRIFYTNIIGLFISDFIYCFCDVHITTATYYRQCYDL